MWAQPKLAVLPKTCWRLPLEKGYSLLFTVKWERVVLAEKGCDWPLGVVLASSQGPADALGTALAWDQPDSSFLLALFASLLLVIQTSKLCFQYFGTRGTSKTVQKTQNSSF